MALFQQSVLRKYLNGQNDEQITQLYQAYCDYFHNLQIQENIRNSKEEQYQATFLNELFVNIFGYTLNPNPNFNLTTEYKNLKDSKKADGAILIDGTPLAVIELKGTDTTDLTKVESQAFGYKNNQPGCRYVVISNFEKLRFFIDNAVEFIEFNLFQLSEDDFKLLYLCLSFVNINADLPKRIKNESLVEEEAITNKLYKDFSNFKNNLYHDLVDKNPQINPLLLYQKTQKLLDRFLFIFFAEDRGLLPPNFIRYVIDNWHKLVELDEETTLYNRFKKNFNYLKDGHSNKDRTIFAYNGGLFETDTLLDELVIDDKLLQEHTQRLSAYDFNTEIDVNILGHIFENSLNEIEEIKAKLQGEVVDKSQTKRKKDGVFYTPRYITKYMVENTIGKLCLEKKADLAINEEEFIKKFKTLDAQLKYSKPLLKKLEAYRDWLKQLTICDPACGSGAFLNEALNYLIAEHEYIAELEKKLTDSSIAYNIENSILENNLFGVDINEESVEIAKLALWLRTAKKDRKLNSLSNNIKCGNSLIDDPAVTGDKAFHWQTEFPQIFANGGFDVVIGNPPYVSHDRIDNKNYLKDKFVTYSSFGDLYIFFYELAYKVLNNKGVSSLITSNSFLKAEYGKPLRKFIKDNSNIEEVINIENTQIFSDAVVNTVILTFNKTKTGQPALVVNSEFKGLDFNIFIEDYKMKYNQTNFLETSWSLTNPKIINLQNKIKGNNKTLEQFNTKIRLGIATGDNNAFLITEDLKSELISKNNKNQEIIKPLLRGRDIDRYFYNPSNLYLLLTKNGIDVRTEYPHIYEYLDSFGDKFKNRGAKGQHWTNLRACSFFDDFKLNKIVWIELTDRGRFTTCNDEIYLLNSAYFLLPPKEFEITFLLSVLNSSIIEFYLKQIANTSGVGTTRWINNYVKEFPIPEIPTSDQQPFIEKADQMLSLNKEQQEVSAKLIRTLQREFSLEKPSKNLENWHELSYADFLEELKKKKVTLSLSEKAEWETYFETEKQKALALQNQINSTDKEIDVMVYELYGLTADEIKIIEKST